MSMNGTFETLEYRELDADYEGPEEGQLGYDESDNPSNGWRCPDFQVGQPTGFELVS